MKKILHFKFIYTLVSLFIFALFAFIIINKDSLFPVYTEMKFKIYGMTCDSCKTKITKQLEHIPGVKQPEIDLESKRLILKLNLSKTDADEIIKTIKDLGYRPQAESRLKLESYNIQFK